MTRPVDTNNPVYEWLRIWNAVTNYNLGAEFLFSDDPRTVDAFRKQPTEESLNRAVADLQNRGGPSPLFEEHAFDLWLKFRAKRLGLSDKIIRVPEVYYSIDIPESRKINLFAPAPADNIDVPFRSAAANSIVELLETQRVVIVFTQVKSETRQIISPRIISNLESQGTSHLYMRLVSWVVPTDHLQKTSGSRLIPIQHADLASVSLKKVLKTSFFRKQKDKKVLVLDFLDYHDWLHTGNKRWLNLFGPLVEAVNSGVLSESGGKIIILLNSDPFSYEKIWSLFYPFFEALNIDQPNVAAAGIYPQYMNLKQALDFLEVSHTDARLLSALTPLLFPLLAETKVLLKNDSKSKAISETLRYILSRLPDNGVLISTTAEEFDRATPTELGLVPRALRPAWGHDFFTIDIDARTINTPELLPANTNKTKPPSRQKKKTPAINPINNDEAADIYLRFEALQKIPKSHFQKPKKLLASLIPLRGRNKELEQHSMEEIVLSLIAAGKINANNPSNNPHFKLAKAYDMYDKSYTLRNIPKIILADHTYLIKYLLVFQDRVAMEISNEQDLEDSAPDGLAHLVKSLYAGGAITESYYNRIRSAADNLMRHKISEKQIQTDLAFDIASRAPYIFKDLIRKAPREIKEKIRQATSPGLLYSEEFRSLITTALKSLLGYYEELEIMGADLGDGILDDLSALKLVVEWNLDALAEDDKDDDPNDSNDTPASPPAPSMIPDNGMPDLGLINPAVQVPMAGAALFACPAVTAIPAFSLAL